MIAEFQIGDERHYNQSEDYFGWGYSAQRARGLVNGLRLLCGLHGHGGRCWLRHRVTIEQIRVRPFRFQLRIRRFGENKPAEPAPARFGPDLLRTVRALFESGRAWRAAACGQELCRRELVATVLTELRLPFVDSSTGWTLSQEAPPFVKLAVLQLVFTQRSFQSIVAISETKPSVSIVRVTVRLLRPAERHKSALRIDAGP